LQVFFYFQVEHIIEAIGQWIDDATKKALGNLALDKNGWIKVDEHFQTSTENVFAGGDIINGGTTAVQAVAEGMKGAVAIHESLMFWKFFNFNSIWKLFIGGKESLKLTTAEQK